VASRKKEFVNGNDIYQAERRRRRADVKAALLPIIQRIEAADERIDFDALASRFRCGKSTLRAIRAELAEEGLCGAGSNHGEPIPPDLGARVARVREAKWRKWRKCRVTCLTEDELREVLPS
jgi:hypothetical protein